MFPTLQRSILHVLAHYARFVEVFFRDCWKKIHPREQEGGEESLVGVTTEGWLASPRAYDLAELFDLVEEHGTPEIVRTLAAVLQRSCALDPRVHASFLALSSACEDLGRPVPGVPAYRYALEVREDVEARLTGPPSMGRTARVEDVQVEDVLVLVCQQFQLPRSGAGADLEQTTRCLGVMKELFVAALENLHRQYPEGVPKANLKRLLIPIVKALDIRGVERVFLGIGRED